MGDEVDDLLVKLGKLDSRTFYYRRDNIQTARVVKYGTMKQAEVEKSLAPIFKLYDSNMAPFQGLDIGDVKCLSHADLEKITHNFSQENVIRKVRHGRLFRGWIADGKRKRQVTVKTWDFVFYDGITKFEAYPRKFRDEIVFLARSEMKAHPFLPNLYGFCFEKKLAVVYDLEFNTSVEDSLTSAEFHWKRRMKVATDYALLQKTLSKKLFGVRCDSSLDIMIDKEYNIKLVDFDVVAFPPGHEIYNSATEPDQAIITGKRAQYELGVLLIELVTKKECVWEDSSRPGEYLAQFKENSIVDESLEIDAAVIGTEITQLIKPCVQTKGVECQSMDTIFEKIVEIAGYRPAVNNSPPWLKRSPSSMA